MSPFPLVKLATLIFKQASKPLANFFKSRAQSNLFFKQYICMPPAQLYHLYETNLKMRLLGLGKAKTVAKLNDEAAAQLGAEMLGELIVFSVGVLCLAFEYQRQQNKDKSKEEFISEKLQDLQKSVNLMTIQIENQDAKIREISRELDRNRK